MAVRMRASRGAAVYVLAAVAGVMLFAITTAPPAALGATDYVVDTTADDPAVALTACTAAANDCSLRGAITNANGSGAGGDTIHFDATVFDSGSPATIEIASSLPLLTGNFDSILADNRGVIIDGIGETRAFNCLTIDASNYLVSGLQLTDCSTAILTLGLRNLNYISKNVIFDNNVGIGIAQDSTGNKIEGNKIGTNQSGTALHPDGGNGQGVQINGDDNDIGNPANPPNIFGGNSGGIVLNAGADGNVINGNRIGIDALGTTALPNIGNGITIVNGNDNVIGGPGQFDGNIIANSSGGHGISIQGGLGSRAERNSIHSNGLLGINLGTDGVTANDVGDADGGPNNLQNFPVLTSAVTSGASLLVEGSLNSTGSASFLVQFYSNPTCDSSGNGEGQTYLGSANVMTDSGGNAVFSTTLGVSVAAGQSITATATNPSNSTSEFSLCHTAVETDSDGDGVPDTGDNCPAWPNAGQNLPAWPTPANDSDCDGFTDAAEAILGTDPAQQCPVSGTPDAWPPDFTKNGVVNIGDVLAFKPVFAQPVPPGPARYDLTLNGAINIGDVLALKPYFTLSCTP